MPDIKSLLLFVSCWLLLAVVMFPSGVSADSVPLVSAEAPVSADVFPIIENHFAVQQAHLVYLTVKEEVGMQATIRYIASRNGPTGTLTMLMVETDRSVQVLGSAASEAELDQELEDLRTTTRQFRVETDRQMRAVSGNPNDLRAEVQSAVESSPELPLLMDKYWRVRERAELEAFDLRVAHARGTLATLAENGHEITPAQEKLEEIITMRSELATALGTRNNAGIELAHKKIHSLSIDYARITNDIRTAGTDNNRLTECIDQSSGVITRSAMINTDLARSGIDTRRAEELVIRAKIQILAARNQSRQQDSAGVKDTLREVSATLTDLRDTYRGILVNEDLPQAIAQSVLSVARSLDTTAAQIGEL